MACKITNINIYLPEKVITNEELAEIHPSWTAEKIEKKIGVKSRRVVKKDETAVDIAVKVCEKLFKNYDKNKIDFLIFCTQSPDYYLPTSACLIQDKLKLKTSIGAFDFNLACSGYIYGLAIAKGLIYSGAAKNILFVTSETYSKHINKFDISNRSIFGDAATATVIEKSDIEHIYEFVLRTDGDENSMIIPNGAMRNPYDPKSPLVEDSSKNKRTANDLYMNGQSIFSYSLDAVPKVTMEALKKNKLTLDEIDYCVFHQTTKYMINHWRRKLKIPKEKFYMNILNTGNTVSSSIPLALKECLDKKLIKEGDKILLSTLGVGHSYGSLVLKI